MKVVERVSSMLVQNLPEELDLDLVTVKAKESNICSALQAFPLIEM